MNCDECRDRVISGGEGEETQSHLAACVSCAAWRRQEASIMSELANAGQAWREKPIGVDVTAMAVPAARPRRIVRYAAAAAVILAAGGLFWAVQTPTKATAMTAMVEQLRAAGVVSFRMESPAKSPPSGRMTVRGRDMRMEMDSGEIVVASSRTGEVAFIRPAQREVMRAPDGSKPIDIYNGLLALANAPRVEEMGRAEIEGRAVEVVRAVAPKALDAVPDALVTVWIDVKTRLPVRVEFPVMVMNDKAKLVFHQFEFGGAVDEAMFDTAPAGYTQVDVQADTPALGLQIGVRARNLGMAFHMYMSAHEDKVPEAIEELAPYIEKDGLRNPRRPSEAVGFVYIKPALPLKYDAVLLHEKFAERAEKIWVVRVDGSSHVLTRDQFEAALTPK